MEKTICPMCEMDDVLESPTRWECATCGHEWERTPAAEEASGPRVVKDANGNVLADGDVVMLIKDLPLKGASQTLKSGTKSKPIRLVDGDHEITCKMDGTTVFLKACFVKKA
ncbi:MAG: phosphonoacetate hydrolase [Elusimicrobia bacterium RIFOXYD12_FULL_66_9]|nr:MAG: phosphonoacetate hydrolase [Elusimicrobia bacterium RIFOXYD12_FULL_66_9]